MRTREIVACIAAAAAVGVGAARLLALPWSEDMVRTRAVLPQSELMLLPPPNTQALGRPRVLDRLEADERLKNPLPASPAVLRQGKAMFDTYCAVCHGADGRTAGPVGKKFRRVSDLTAPGIQAYTDGWLYSVVREGGGNMPRYAETMSLTERWAVVHYIRSLRRPS